MKTATIQIQVNDEKNIAKIQELFSGNPQDIEFILAEIHKRKQRDRNIITKLKSNLGLLNFLK